MIKQETIDRILDAARIEEVVGDFVDLKKRGSSLIGLCPFHNEKTPSFNVSVNKGIFKCFGCGQGGDAVHFIMELEKYSYPEALRYLANKYNIEIEETEQTAEQYAEKSHRESLYIVSNWAGNFFRQSLWETDEGQSVGLSYFRERGYRDDIINKFELGYSPESWDALCLKAVEEGHQVDFLEETGLAIKRDDGRVYDRFRARVIFPIHNLTGRILGFGGRTLKSDKKVPKYVNSPESEIYHKSNVLYGLYLAKKAISQENICYLVEGYADVIAMHQVGIENVVSSSGTSLTEGQIRLISRYTKNVTILYDGDEAGIKASLRGTDMLLKEGMNVKVLLFPDGDDPDSYAKKVGTPAFREYLTNNIQDFIFYKTKILLRDAGNDPIKKAEVIHEVLESISLIPDEIKVSVFIRECSTLLDVEERALIVELNKLRRSAQKKTATQGKDASAGNRATSPSPMGDMPPADLFDDDAPAARVPEEKKEGQSVSLALKALHEREVVRLLLHYGEMPATWLEADQQYPIAIVLLVDLQDIVFEDPVCKKIVDIYLDYTEKESLPPVRSFVSHEDRAVADLAVSLLSSPYNLSPNWNDDKRNIYVAQETDNLKSAVLGAVYRLKKQRVEKEMQTIREEMRQVATDDDLNLLLYKYQKLKQMEKDLAAYLGTVVVK
ncbi:DNA primase [Olivibacter sitiensis]|uniref:DNA primase n=1 Tax=Olivibacter sitiensis TaxID=376470 RepID=UPI0004160A34|nr:DNA primase [Olivibacter sitiensis]